MKLLVFMLLAFSCASCAGQTYDVSFEIKPIDTLPGESYVLVSEIRERTDSLVDAWIEEEERVAGCMRSEGFDYRVRSISVEYPDSGSEGRVLTATEFAQEFGYGIGFDDANSGIQITIDAHEVSKDLLDEFAVALDENPGCGLNQTMPQAEDLIEEQRFESFSSVEEDRIQRILASQEYLDALHAWGLCMSERGHEGGGEIDPFVEAEGFYDNASTPDELLEAQMAERQIATDDLECRGVTVFPVIAEAS